jgi:hypothetical protein
MRICCDSGSSPRLLVADFLHKKSVPLSVKNVSRYAPAFNCLLDYAVVVFEGIVSGG